MKIQIQLCASGQLVAFTDQDGYLKFDEPFDPSDRHHALVANDTADPIADWREGEMDREEFLARMRISNERMNREYDAQIAALNARDRYFTSGQFDEDEEG